MSAFDTWLSNQDRGNGRNLRVKKTPAGLEAAYLDYGHSMSVSWTRSGAISDSTVVPPYPASRIVDQGAPWEIVGRIERLPDTHIAEVVDRIPAAFLPVGARVIIRQGLLHRKGAVRRLLLQAARS